MSGTVGKLVWGLVAVGGAMCLGVVALNRGESVNAIWLVAAALSVFAIAYRFYSKFIADKVLGLDPTRATPAQLRNDGLDYVPTDKWIVYGHHFAAIAGAGPLVGPVLAAQMGYLPGTLWILAGVVLAGAVQDFMILALSLRRDARSLGHMLRAEMGNVAGVTCMIGVLILMMIVLAVLALVVVKALAISPWGTFTVACTIPIAILMGIYLRFVRPGRVLEVSIIGLILLLASIWLGGVVAADPVWSTYFTFDAKQLAWLVIGYGFFASVLPVWLLLAPRDYLSTFLKIGTIGLLAIAILFAAPYLQMPAVTKFIDGSGPVFQGNLFPFLFITIACGAVSGWHSIISSGTTPKLLANEREARMVGYGGMLTEAAVAVMAIIAASALHPGVYFAMNSPAALIGADVQSAATAISQWGFVVTPDQLTQTAKDIGESTILSRAGGAPTLAVGMAQLLHGIMPGEGMMAFWYHYAILFEALFILTTVDAGTRVGRFMIQELVGLAVPALQKTESWTANIVTTVFCVAIWGYFLYSGAVDPLGGINTLWPLFGIANQMLAAIALTLCLVVVVKKKLARYAWVPGIPAAWLVICTLSAGWVKLLDVKIGFPAAAAKYADGIAQNKLIAPAKTMDEMHRIVTNNTIDAVLTGIFMALVVATVVFAVRAIIKANAAARPTINEEPYVALSSLARSS
ncbi:MAG: carbon starvation protein A [Rudaea sp.]|uniref:carbon starvation CstA family protein n=1 Tax=unclassified Rudaea TaxID=2627037 RepID=UPI0010F4DC59|nr:MULTISPECIES: carbon starvation CstA family protein [unclassified Rudaea]MBN8888287.1 carbon starvation protein A [Rudaea sp.]MBR0347369.1 carbon starvation protein A [Rudaea sp.]